MPVSRGAQAVYAGRGIAAIRTTAKSTSAHKTSAPSASEIEPAPWLPPPFAMIEFSNSIQSRTSRIPRKSNRTCRWVRQVLLERDITGRRAEPGAARRLSGGRGPRPGRRLPPAHRAPESRFGAGRSDPGPTGRRRRSPCPVCRRTSAL